ncbi:alpha/beta fold hydrolase [Streptoalloteichus hindustanus]|uniref:Pimeloyl-ACP methyl ester carboxylesterase n=1 Tax=Streptoalloteichus hindustanus TaxID=2017 RepID=A0A1M4YTN2_STRHI|nr:alpha/beta fold hydrolase [Streptoalloteichus hindustanus]SHF09115.1 Pimeloyl-ACP methyl ester carboxylesterase [Streptoalloteichus hindustanus]
MGDGIGGFVDAASRERFLAAYDRVMSAWPVERSELDVETGFGRTRVHRSGQETGTPVVLLHGQGATSGMWVDSVGSLAARRPVFAVDTLGEAGRSTQTAPIRRPEDTAAWLDEVLTGLEVDRAHLVGASYGGWIALNQALRQSERVVSLSVLDPARAVAGLNAGFVFGGVWMSLAGSDAARRRFLAGLTGEREDGPQMDLTVASLYGYRIRLLPPRYLGDDELRAITAPTLALFGAESKVHDPARGVARARALMPSVEADLVPGARHFIPADVIGTRVVSFLDEVEARSAA